MTSPAVRRASITVLAAMMLLSSCGDSPEALLASAKDYLAKNDKPAAIIQLRNALQEQPDLAEARFLLGRTLLDAGDVVGAEKELRKALELQYPADQVVPPLASALVRLRQYREILTELVRVPVSAPQAQAELLTAVGQAHAALKNPRVAHDAFAQALTAQPNYVPAHLGLARVLASSGELARAASEADTTLAISPADSDAWQLKGDILLAQKQREPALAAYRKAVAVNAKSISAYTAIVALLLEDDRLDEAAKQVETMRQAAPTHPKTLYLQALIAYRQKDFNGARQAIQLQLRAAPDGIPGLLLAGAIESELKAYGQAEEYLSRVMDRSPRLARGMLISMYVRSGQAAKALDTLKPALDNIGKDSDMLALAAQVFVINGQLAAAADYFAKAAATDPGDPQKRAAAALTQIAKGDWDKGLDELEQTATIDTGIRADLGLIAAHSKRGEYDKALHAIAALEKKRPGTPMPPNLRGAALLAKRDFAGARQSFERALQIDPTYFLAAANLAELDLIDKKPKSAQERFESVLAKDPNQVQSLVALAHLRAEAARAADRRWPRGMTPSDADEGVTSLLTKAIAAQPTDPTPRLALIDYYTSLNDTKQAAAAAQAAVAALPKRPEILDAAGRAYQAAGDPLQALTAYTKLASIQRTSPVPYLRMADLQWAAKNKDDAVRSVRKALEIRPDSVEAQTAMIGMEVERGRLDEALTIARQVQKQRPADSVGHLLEGRIYASQKKWREAVTAYRAGLAKSKSSDLAIRLYGALSETNRAEAEQLASTWLRDHPDDAEFRVYLAQSAAARNDYTVAAQHYRKLLDSLPNNVLYLNNLAAIEGRLKNPSALEHAEKANKLAPGQPEFMDTLGQLLVEKGEIARGLELLQKASAMAPQAPSIRLNFAKALIQAGRKDAARTELDELAKLGEKFSAQSEVAQLRQRL